VRAAPLWQDGLMAASFCSYSEGLKIRSPTWAWLTLQNVHTIMWTSHHIGHVSQNPFKPCTKIA
jgi:hypothetical protein